MALQFFLQERKKPVSCEGKVFVFAFVFSWFYFERSLMWAVILGILSGVLGFVLKKIGRNADTGFM